MNSQQFTAALKNYENYVFGSFHDQYFEEDEIECFNCGNEFKYKDNELCPECHECKQGQINELNTLEFLND